MIIKIQLWEPIISTIPDDTMLFAILDPSRALSSKIIAENYINFYALRHPYVGDVIFRFENLIDYESIHGLTRLFIPKEYMLPFVENMGFFADLLKKVMQLICLYQSKLSISIVQTATFITIC